MPTQTRRKSAQTDEEVAPVKKKEKLRLVEQQQPAADPPPGDESLTLEAMAGWKEGQRRCRGRKRHNWGPYTVYEHGTFWDVVEQCSHCRNRRHAPFVPTARGMRKNDKWKPDYRDGYLLPKGAMRITEDLQDELTAADILSRRIVEVPDEDEE